MQTPAHGELAYTLTRHYFGDSVAIIVRALFRYDQAPLRVLRSELSEIKPNILKRALLILVKYQLVDYTKTVKNFRQQYEYCLVPQRLFAFFRNYKFIRMLKLKEDATAGILLSVITQRAMMNRENLLQTTLARIKPAPPASEQELDRLKNLIERLISQRYLVETSNNLCLNIERFNRTYRDDLIIETIYRYYNKEEQVKSLCKAILDLSLILTSDDSAVTAPVPIKDFGSPLIPTIFLNQDQMELYLNRLTSEINNRFFIKCGLHPDKGPLFAINVGLVIDYLVKEHMSSMITTRFGPKCARVFRVLLLRGPLLLKQIEEMIMLPARDVREYSYMLIREGLIRNRQVPKTPDNAPGKSVFIMSVELDQVIYNATDLCCRSINNILIRYEFELRRNKPLLDRAKAVQELLVAEANGGEVNQEDWNQYFNSYELSELNRVNKILDRLLLAKTQVDENLFLFHTWLHIKPNLEVSGDS